MKIKVYSKLSLGAATLKKLLPRAEISGPIQRGDLAQDLFHYNVVLIIDGKFHHNLAVSCDEIRDALACGLKIYGSSSMGALRASELSDFGMIGYGKIYEHIKATPYFRDDILGQVFVERNESVEAVIAPFIDYYFNLRCLAAAKKINKYELETLTEAALALYYAERDWTKLQDKIKQMKKNPDRLLKIADQAQHKMGSQKNRDAIGLCKKVVCDLRLTAQANSTLC